MRRTSDRRGERGQVLVLFTLAMVGLIGLVGLVLDGGSAFAQRRDEQNAADLAAMAGATAYLNTTGSALDKKTAAESAARAVAASNGYTDDPTANLSVAITVTGNAFAGSVAVDIGKQHRNTFSGLLGQPEWGVAVSATAETSEQPNGARGVLPLLFNEDAFNDVFLPNGVCDEDEEPCTEQVFQLPGVGNEDVPQDATQFNYTVFCTANGNPCNANSDLVKDIIREEGTGTTVWVEDTIAPLNAGTHADIFDVLDDEALGGTFPVPIVDDTGQIVGFAYFHLTAIEGNPDRVIKGYFVSPYWGDHLEFSFDHDEASLETDVFELKLVD